MPGPAVIKVDPHAHAEPQLQAYGNEPPKEAEHVASVQALAQSVIVESINSRPIAILRSCLDLGESLALVGNSKYCSVPPG